MYRDWNGKKLVGAFIDQRGTQYGPDWLGKSSPADRDALGITTHPDPTYPDPRTHTYTEDAAGNVTPVARPAPTVLADAITRINAECERRILARYPLTKQSSARGLLYGPEYLAAMDADIVSMIEASNTACDAAAVAEGANDLAGIIAAEEGIAWPF